MDSDELEAQEMELRAMVRGPISCDPENPSQLVELPHDDRGPDEFDFADFWAHREADRIVVEINYSGSLDKWQTRDLAIALIEGGKNLLCFGSDLPSERPVK